jgi:hypothetical protein
MNFIVNSGETKEDGAQILWRIPIDARIAHDAGEASVQAVAGYLAPLFDGTGIVRVETSHTDNFTV